MKKLTWALFYLFIFSLLIFNSFSYLDSDYPWHLKFGEITWQTKDVPHDQIYMWTLAGKTWVDHEWLGDLVLYATEAVGGYVGATMFFALIPLIALICINRYVFSHYLKTKESRILLGVIEIGAVLAMRPHLGIRLQEITLLLLCLLLIVLDSAHRRQSWRPLLWLPLILYIWACSHAGFLIGIVIVLAWLGCQFMLLVFPRLSTHLASTTWSKKNFWIITLICLVSLAITLATPYGLELYAFLSEYANPYYMRHIQEWLPPYYFPIHYAQISLNAIAISTIAGTAWALKKKLPLFNYMIAVMFAILAFKSMRHFPLFMGAWLILILPHCLNEISAGLKKIPLHSTAWITASCLTALSIGLLSSAKFTNDPLRAYCDSYPCGAAAFLKAHPQYSDRLFNHYNFGAFFIGAAPDVRLFVDGRLPQYPFADSTLLEEYNNFSNPKLIGEKINAYAINNIVYALPPGEQTFNWFEYYVLGYRSKDFIDTNSPLLDYLKASPQWKLVYSDTLSVIYARQ